MTSTELTTNAPKPSLAGYAARLEQIFDEIDNLDGEITEEVMARFDDASLAVAGKVSGWIYYLDALKAFGLALKERKERATKQLKASENLQARLREYLKGIIIANPGVPFESSEGKLCLQDNPESVSYSFTTENKTFYSTVPAATLAMFPQLRSYLTGVTILVIDGPKVKADLKVGKQLDFATLVRGQHLRIR